MLVCPTLRDASEVARGRRALSRACHCPGTYIHTHVRTRICISWRSSLTDLRTTRIAGNWRWLRVRVRVRSVVVAHTRLVAGKAACPVLSYDDLLTCSSRARRHRHTQTQTGRQTQRGAITPSSEFPSPELRAARRLCSSLPCPFYARLGC